MEVNLKHICKNCMFIQRPFRKDSNDSEPCKKLGKFVKLTDGESCQFFMRFNEAEWRLRFFGV